MHLGFSNRYSGSSSSHDKKPHHLLSIRHFLGRKRRFTRTFFMVLILLFLTIILVKLQFDPFGYLPFLIQRHLRLNSETGFLERKNYICNYLWFQRDWTARALPKCSRYISHALVGDEPIYHQPATIIEKAKYSTEKAYEPYTAHQKQACKALDTITCPLEWVTFTTSCNTGTSRFGEGLQWQNIKLSVYGYETSWKRRWGMRMRILHNHLISLPANKLVIFSDIDDVLLLPSSTASDILATYEALVHDRNGPLVFFGAEKECFPDKSLASLYPYPEKVEDGKYTPSPFRFLNAGMIVGRAGHLIELLRLAYQGDCFDDQAQWTNAFVVDPIMWWIDVSGKHMYGRNSTIVSKKIDSYIKKNVMIGLDYWNDMFGALVNLGVEDVEISTGIPPSSLPPHGTVNPTTGHISSKHNGNKATVKFKATSGHPLILHQNGEKEKGKALVMETIAMLTGFENYNEQDAGVIKLRRGGVVKGGVSVASEGPEVLDEGGNQLNRKEMKSRLLQQEEEERLTLLKMEEEDAEGILLRKKKEIDMISNLLSGRQGEGGGGSPPIKEA